MYQNKKILIFGIAKSGFACANLLAGQNQIIITDQKEPSETQKKH